MRHIIYIINPISGKGAKDALRQLIEQKTKAKNILYQIFPSVAGGDYSFLLPIIQEQNITDIVIAGGDGTVSQVVNSLMNTDVQFGIIPCGSGNGLALAANISKNPTKAIELIFNGKAKATDGFFINEKFACMLSGLGFDAKVAHDFAQQSRRGRMTYITQAIKNFFSAKAYSFELTINEESFSTEAFFISIANSNQFGNNFKIAPQASLSDGLLDIVIAARQNKFRLLVETIRQISGWNKLQKNGFINMKKGIIYFQTANIFIRNLSQAPLHIDGDPAETPEAVTIQIKKKCFRLIRP